MNRVLAHTGVKYPIVQAPMGWIARSQLASAVSNAGGLGIIETSSGEVDACLAEIEKMKRLTDKPFGVNLPILFITEPRVVDLVARSGVKFVSTSAGSPAKLLPVLKAAGLIVYHVVPNLSSALKAVEAGVDGLIVEGGEGGGFKNPDDVSTLVLLQAVREQTDVPIIAAGGICDGFPPHGIPSGPAMPTGAPPPIEAMPPAAPPPANMPPDSRSLLPMRMMARIDPRRSASTTGSTPGSSRVLTNVSTPATASSW